MYKLESIKHITRLTPPFWRKVFFISWLETILFPLNYVNDQFLAFIAAKRNDLKYNGQTYNVQRLLNDLFDPELRRITIEHSIEGRDFDYFFSEVQDGDFDYTIAEAADPRYNKFIQERVNSGTIDGFRVRVPLELDSLESQIRGYILRYKIAGVNYEILYF